MIAIDVKAGTVQVRDEDGSAATHSLSSPEAFEIISSVWLRAGWDTKYVYSFTWLGRPIIQLPEDMFRLQELIHSLKPDVIVETGVAHGGSLIFYASLCKAMGHGRVIGIDVQIRPHNRAAIESHLLAPFIQLVEGSSIDPKTVSEVRNSIAPGQKVLVLLDSCHTKEHVLAELHAYSPLVAVGSYIVAMDGIMAEVVGTPRTQEDWNWNNPIEAVNEFVEKNKNFALVEPPFEFNEGTIRKRITYWPSAFLKRIA